MVPAKPKPCERWRSGIADGKTRRALHIDTILTGMSDRQCDECCNEFDLKFVGEAAPSLTQRTILSGILALLTRRSHHYLINQCKRLHFARPKDAIMSAPMFDGLQLDETHTIEKTISESDVYMFAGIVGDFHPNHVNAVYAAKGLGRRVAHGALLPGFISRCAVELIGKRLSSPGYAAQEFTIKCIAPVFIGDTISVRVWVRALEPERRKILMDAEITNQDGTVCAVGGKTIKVLKPRNGDA
jgi:3-hydroxybutyryl-CoA dehydratase